MSEVGVAVDIETAAGLWDAAPQSGQAVRQAQAVLREQGATANIEWERRMASPMGKRQREWTRGVHDALKERMMGSLTEEEKVEVRTAGGGGAGSFLLVATEDEQQLPDAHFKAALQRRLRVRRPAGGVCKHRHKTTGGGGALCGMAPPHCLTCSG